MAGPNKTKKPTQAKRATPNATRRSSPGGGTGGLNATQMRKLNAGLEAFQTGHQKLWQQLMTTLSPFIGQQSGDTGSIERKPTRAIPGSRRNQGQQAQRAAA